LIDKLSFLKGASDGGAGSVEEERLMQLFQNRAGLKKAHADLQDEFYLLRDRLKQQEGATIRVQEQLDALGELLGDPATGFNALVFFQLRSLWKVCHQQLTQFAAELTRTQEAREIARHAEDCEIVRRSRVSDADARLAAAQTAFQDQQTRLGAIQAELARRRAFWHYFGRRRLQKAVDAQRQEVSAADSAVLRILGERRAVAEEAAPPFPGISLAARRNINLAIIGYAELLCEHVDAFGLTSKAKEAVARRVQEMSFGSRLECEGYMQRVQAAIAAVTGQKQVNGSVKLKLDRLRASCDYRNAADTVPTADSLAAPGAAKPVRLAVVGGAPAAPAAPAGPAWNVLAEDYWDVYTLMLR
jgi:hypothetical protein